ncbi:hypothetical protein Dtox_4077 [Desulfofarcimen acetoxidans DSM 771]|uniref:Uncharacterized protein n=1 Tax=Desulfofarcimen acetoxidans (strain ATCC 49208 / DSM 771 / KCTC 5769 / VKM B-1644 / 5575) TaxID=485916 RepID=C8VYN1_DESAS|nr:hypothetical protein Dtox_4077 [Desulfofarcimen acetoxidans DSM 771]
MHLSHKLSQTLKRAMKKLHNILYTWLSYRFIEVVLKEFNFGIVFGLGMLA